ncbi:acetolactate synthase large subunit [Parahaliea mediterranea]|uniref:Acetolactate synthase large subunit n=1 Tax=Parahaliea mediterranea TaxID=651086 RepID=A0A939DG06_9GAMM|nr:acetolactate synthase large subunit [Parahaliea mediterranea]MBN7797573.1 acetolactate synthase large subunit [Parahaliea mediterranea]
MNGAESLIKTLVDSGVEVCFTNPGTSEMHFVAALDEVEGMRCVLCLFEGVVSGAAHGYAVMARKPASTLLHLGPGLGNALANVHNARKGHVPVVNIVGDHATYHLEYDAPLTSDIEAIAGPVSHWVYSSTAAEDIARDAAVAVQQAGHGQVATLILPADVSWGDNPNGAAAPAELPALTAVASDRIERAQAMLRSGKQTVIMIGGREVSAAQGEQLSRIAQASGARVLTETFPSRVRRGAGTAAIERLPYLAELAIEELKGTEQLILLGADAPVSFFAYPNVPSVLTPPDCEVLPLAGPDDDIDGALAALVKALQAGDIAPQLRPLQLPEAPVGALDANSAAQALAHHLPEDAIVVDEGITSGLACFPVTAGARPHDWLNLTGGSIGWGLPAAVGAAIAQPDRKVVCLEGDGSAMYTIQSLWTMAREQLDVTVVLFNNRKYSVLEVEFARTGARGGKPGPKAASSLAIGSPDMDFQAMASGMGVRATVATTAEEFSEQLADAMAHRGPCLIDARVPPLELGW